jgi:hypothetical protein
VSARDTANSRRRAQANHALLDVSASIAHTRSLSSQFLGKRRRAIDQRRAQRVDERPARVIDRRRACAAHSHKAVTRSGSHAETLGNLRNGNIALHRTRHNDVARRAAHNRTGFGVAVVVGCRRNGRKIAFARHLCSVERSEHRRTFSASPFPTTNDQHTTPQHNTTQRNTAGSSHITTAKRNPIDSQLSFAMEDLPRFPQTFLDVLGTIAAFDDVLALTSVDRRERVSRVFWIDRKAKVHFNTTVSVPEQRAFLAAYPHCVVRQTVSHTRQICARVRELAFFDAFNEPLDRVELPQTITHLSFGMRFDKSLRNVKLPRSLTHLRFGWSFRAFDTVQFPRSLKEVRISRLTSDRSFFTAELPAGTELVIEARVQTFP